MEPTLQLQHKAGEHKMALTGNYITVKLRRSDNDENTFDEWQMHPEHDNDEDNHQELIALMQRLTADMKDRS